MNKKIAFHNSKVGIKMNQTIYVAFYKKSGTYKDYTVLNKKTHKKHYQHLKEYYEYTNIELYIVTCEINNSHSKKVILSYKTHPDIKVIDIITGSCGIPVRFKPTIINDKY